jgi:hypothetical protein
MANVLNTDKQIAIIAALAEGSSIRSIERMTGIHRDTIMRLGVKVGQGCTALLDSKSAISPAIVWRLMRFGATSARKKPVLRRTTTQLLATFGHSAQSMRKQSWFLPSMWITVARCL